MKIDKKPHIEHWIDVKAEKNSKLEDPLAIDGIDHLEIYVGNAKQAVFFFNKAFGLKPLAYRGPENGYREAVSYVVSSGEIMLVLTTPLTMTHHVSSQLLIHGDTVHSISLTVPDCVSFYEEAMRRGATSAAPPIEQRDSNGNIRTAAIKTYGDTIHKIVERDSYKGTFWPGFVPYEEAFPTSTLSAVSTGLQNIDHVVGNVKLGDMNKWVSFYEDVLGFKEMLHFSDEDISTEYSALMSKVMRGGGGKIKFPINEPAEGKRKSQIDEYLQFHNGPGVQHIALRSDDIIKTVSRLKENGVTFLRVPKTYYDEVPARVGKIKEDLQRLAELGILVDRDDDGYLLQIFTKPVQDRPTLFFEVIQREGSQGFGAGNFKALFEAIERDQELRGNL